MNRIIARALIAALFVCGGCSSNKHDSADCERCKEKMKMASSTTAPDMAPQSMMAARTAVATMKPSRSATTQPMNNDVAGTVTFKQVGDAIQVSVALTGLQPNSTHGFHIHEKGDLSDPDLKSAGGHFNPTHHHHGGPESGMAHAGDLGNLNADPNGNVNTVITIKGVTLDNGPLGIIGRSVILHAKDDDLMTDPAGNSGARIAGGVIEAK